MSNKKPLLFFPAKEFGNHLPKEDKPIKSTFSNLKVIFDEVIVPNTTKTKESTEDERTG